MLTFLSSAGLMTSACSSRRLFSCPWPGCCSWWRSFHSRLPACCMLIWAGAVCLLPEDGKRPTLGLRLRPSGPEAGPLPAPCCAPGCHSKWLDLATLAAIAHQPTGLASERRQAGSTTLVLIKIQSPVLSDINRQDPDATHDMTGAACRC